ncbi:MAG: hypothetical protein LBC73_08600 [Oscillospiraceae bacterium]|nr:hypothetical protein [Oscillospiraceae bacterium]
MKKSIYDGFDIDQKLKIKEMIKDGDRRAKDELYPKRENMKLAMKCLFLGPIYIFFLGVITSYLIFRNFRDDPFGNAWRLFMALY